MRLEEKAVLAALKRETAILAAVPAAELLLALVLVFGPEGVALPGDKGGLLCFTVAAMMLIRTAGVLDRVFDLCTRPPEHLPRALRELHRPDGEDRRSLASSVSIVAITGGYVLYTGDTAALLGAVIAVAFVQAYLAARRRFDRQLARLLADLPECPDPNGQCL